MTLSWADLASRASVADGPAFAEELDFTQEKSTYPSGAHIALVEVDVETGHVTLLRLVAVDDCGTVINPAIVAGQVHGGLAQGVGQALFEAVVYDESGTPLTTTLVDYGIPSAVELPSWELGEIVTPSPRNPLGAKGVGESGAVGGAIAVQNAVIDALSHLGVTHMDMPLSPERVWEALRRAGEVQSAAAHEEAR